MYENYVSINCNLATFYFLNFVPDAWKMMTPPAEMIKDAGIQLDTTTSHLASKGSLHWMDRLKNIAGMLHIQAGTQSIICLPWWLHTSVLGCCIWPRGWWKFLYASPSHFPACQKLHSEKALLLSSRVIIYLSKRDSSQRAGALLGL